MKWRRYEKYKDSGIEWLGEVPGHWNVTALRRSFTIVNGATPKSGEPEYWDGDIAWVTPEDIGDLHGDTLFETKRTISRAGYESCGTTLVPAGSIVLSTRAPIGHIALAGTPLCTNQGCRSLVLHSMGDGRFFYYILAAGKTELQSLGQGSTFTELSRDKLASVYVCQPSLPEQVSIASFLDRETVRIDALIEKKQRQIELLKEKRAALISHAVTKGLDPNVKMKDSGIEWLGEVPEHWEVTKLGFQSSVKARLGWKGLKAEEYVDEGYIFLSTPNIKGNEIDFDGVNYITAERFLESPEIMLREGDILIAKDGSTLGITNWVRSLPAPATVNSSIAVIRPLSSVESGFLYWLLSCDFTQNVIQKIKDGQGVPHLFQDDLRKFWIWLPSREEQQNIVSFLDAATSRVDYLLEKVNDSISTLREYRTALISAAVTGKIDVREKAA